MNSPTADDLAHLDFAAEVPCDGAGHVAGPAHWRVQMDCPTCPGRSRVRLWCDDCLTTSMRQVQTCGNCGTRAGFHDMITVLGSC